MGPAGRRRPQLLALVLLLLADGVPALRDVQVTVPQAVAAGETVTLTCRYDLETDVLYSVKWYRGRQEFFRYIPKEHPNTRIFPLVGINVDISRSGAASVVLRKVQPSISGRYRCEVSADAPSFHTAMKTSYMHVVELPEFAPEIVSNKSRVAVGDSVQADCVASPAYPPANLTWLLNNRPIDASKFGFFAPVKHLVGDLKSASSAALLDRQRNVTKSFGSTYSSWDGASRLRRRDAGGGGSSSPAEAYDERLARRLSRRSSGARPDSADGSRSTAPPVAEPPLRRASRSRLVFTVEPDSLVQGRMTLTCQARVFSVYNASAHFMLEGEKPQIASVLGTRESASDGSSLGAVDKMAIVLAFLWFQLSQ